MSAAQENDTPEKDIPESDALEVIEQERDQYRKWWREERESAQAANEEVRKLSNDNRDLRKRFQESARETADLRERNAELRGYLMALTDPEPSPEPVEKPRNIRGVDRLLGKTNRRGEF